jgi:hypothetical protein
MPKYVVPPPRAVDHLVLPTENLDVARARLTALGFTVAPVGVHPFGTENACVFLADGTYLEPLAVRDDRQTRDAVRQGNVFVARDEAYRYRRGEEGFSALVFATPDAQQDHADFEGEGMSAGKTLVFSRDFTDAAGNSGTATFKLAFAADLRAPDVFFVTCQRINMPNVDRAGLQSHLNGVKRLRRVALSAREPYDYANIALIAADAPMTDPLPSHVRFAAGNATIEVFAREGLQSEFGLDEIDDPGLHMRCAVFGVEKLSATKAHLDKNAVHYDLRTGRLVVPPAPGQGAAFAFEEIS